jgi:hypothetical protein
LGIGCLSSRNKLREAPEAVRAAGVDVLLVDQAELAGGTVAERLGLPFVTAILTLPFNRYPSVPFCCYHDTINRGIVARQKRLGQCAGSSAGCQ